MTGKISVIINTLNEQKNIERVVRSVKWADEIIVCDMHSEDDSAIIAKKLGARVVLHKRQPFVELARNFIISHASHEWILILDPDEEIPGSLAGRLLEMAEKQIVSTFVEVPRKNLIFGKWMKASMWWPDYNIRFFKKGFVTWGNRIHRPPKTSGQGIKLPAEERWAIIHHHYESTNEFLDRANRYSTIQAKELEEEKYQFLWTDLIKKPLGEFLSRYFANRGFEDGLHGLTMGLLQSYAILLVYVKLWEMIGSKQQDINFEDVRDVSEKAGGEIRYWFKYGNLSQNPLKRFIQRARNKL